MTYLLDASVCVAHLRFGARSAVTARLRQLPPQEVAICSVVRGELLYGYMALGEARFRKRESPRS